MSNFAHVDPGWVLAIVENHRTCRTGLIRILDFVLKGLSDSLWEKIIEVFPAGVYGARPESDGTFLVLARLRYKPSACRFDFLIGCTNSCHKVVLEYPRLSLESLTKPNHNPWPSRLFGFLFANIGIATVVGDPRWGWKSKRMLFLAFGQEQRMGRLYWGWGSLGWNASEVEWHLR